MIKWGAFSNPTGKKYRQIEISNDSDWELFEAISDYIVKALNGKWINQLDGMDERYWDLDVGGVVLTLHLQHYLGITLYYKDEIDDEPLHILDNVFKFIINKSI